MSSTHWLIYVTMYVFLHLQVFMHVLLEGSTVCVWCRVSWEWHFFFSYYGI